MQTTKKFPTVLVTIVGVLILAAVITLALSDEQSHAGTIATLIGLLALVVTQLVTNSKIDDAAVKADAAASQASDLTNKVATLDDTVRNGGIEGPMANVLVSQAGQDAVKSAVHDALSEHGLTNTAPPVTPPATPPVTP